MEQIKKFLHGKGFALVLAACLLAAAAAGVWAVRTDRDELIRIAQQIEDTLRSELFIKTVIGIGILSRKQLGEFLPLSQHLIGTTGPVRPHADEFALKKIDQCQGETLRIER